MEAVWTGGRCPNVQSSPSFPHTLGSPGPDPVDTMLLPIFRKQELPEPSGDQAAGVTSWEASSGTCFSWCPPGDCIPLNLTHIFSGLGVNLQARVATPGEPPRAPGVTWDAGLVSGCCAPRILPSRSSVFVNHALGTSGSWVHLV